MLVHAHVCDMRGRCLCAVMPYVLYVFGGMWLCVLLCVLDLLLMCACASVFVVVGADVGVNVIVVVGGTVDVVFGVL